MMFCKLISADHHHHRRRRRHRHTHHRHHHQDCCEKRFSNPIWRLCRLFSLNGALSYDGMGFKFGEKTIKDGTEVRGGERGGQG